MRPLAPCPRGKLRNPATGRCVKKFGKVGIMVQRAYREGVPDYKFKTPKHKKCKKGKKRVNGVCRKPFKCPPGMKKVRGKRKCEYRQSMQYMNYL